MSIAPAILESQVALEVLWKLRDGNGPSLNRLENFPVGFAAPPSTGLFSPSNQSLSPPPASSTARLELCEDAP